MKRILLIVWLSIIAAGSAYAQGEQNIWAFGEGAGLNFNIAGPASYSNYLFPGYEGCASICDAAGNMLFYSNGLWVWNRNSYIMPALTGGVSGYTWPVAVSVGYPPLMPYTGSFATQAAAICGVPNQPRKYYLFSLNSSGQLYYSMIDTTLDGGNGDLISGRIGIYIGGGLTGKMTVVKGCNATWLIVHSLSANEYKAYEINDTGIVLTPIISNCGSLPLSWYRCGVIKFSPDGRKMAAACNKGDSQTGGLELYDFDYRTGKLSNAIVLDSNHTGKYYYGACFSPDNTKLYATTSSYGGITTTYPGKVRQFDVSLSSSAAIIGSNTLLYTDTSVQTGNMGDLKRGIDGKIYIGNNNISSAGEHMHLISSPDIAGTGCNFIPNAVSLPTGTWLYKGLPNDVVLMTPPDTIRMVKNISGCFVDSIMLSADSGKNYQWQDNSSSRNIVVHANGIYTVGYVNNNCEYEKDTFRVNFVHVPTIAPNGYTCNNEKQGLAWVKPAAGDTAMFTFIWKDSNGNVLQQHTVHTADTINRLDTGIYTVYMQSLGGCDTTLQVRILGIPSPHAAVNADTIICMGAIASLKGNTDAPVWKWYFGDGDSSGSLNAIHYYTQAGNYTAQFVVSNIEGCSDTVRNEIQVKNFKIRLSSDKDNVNIGEQILLQSTAGEPYTVTAWEPEALFIDQSAISQTIIMDSTKQFIVIGHSVEGCIDSATINISVNPSVFMPTAFSPNGDGLNDRFRPRTAGSGVFIDNFEIYNRWGQMVWFGYGAKGAEGWDGKFHGTDAEIGTYFYTIHMVTPSGGTIALKGDVTLIR